MQMMGMVGALLSGLLAFSALKISNSFADLMSFARPRPFLAI